MPFNLLNTENSMIVRTSGVYGYSRNFPKFAYELPFMPFNLLNTEIEEVKLIEPKKFPDERGYFLET